MKINIVLKQKDKGISFEFFPPTTESRKRILIANIKDLKEYNPLYVSMTCGAGGVTKDSAEEAVDLLLEQGEPVVMPHLTSINMKMSDVKDLLNRYKEKGIKNIMALRGDPPQEDNGFCFLKQDFCYARDLVKFIKKTGYFCVGVAVYPEGHIETSSLEQDMEHTKQKIDAGADFAVTQMFFNNKYYYAFLDRMEKQGISIPVLPGILPLTDIAKVKQFVSICRTTIPKEIEDTMGRFTGNPADMEKAGIDFTIKQCRDLIKNGTKRLHFFTLNRLAVMKAILDAVF